MERESTGDDKGSLALQAVREEGSRPKRGYLFQVSRDDVAIGSFQSQSGAPTVLPDLDPGEYTIIVSGRKIDPHDFV